MYINLFIFYISLSSACTLFILADIRYTQLTITNTNTVTIKDDGSCSLQLFKCTLCPLHSSPFSSCGGDAEVEVKVKFKILSIFEEK